MPSTDDLAAAEDWARSGAMALTGYPDGPALLARGAAATSVRTALTALALDREAGVGPTLLGERAALAGLTRRAPWSVGGAFRILPAADGWLGVSLPRPDDLAAVPALVESTVDDPWEAVTRWSARTPVADAVERAVLLGLPISSVPVELLPIRRRGVLTHDGGARPARTRPPRVVDLSSLWAGPLCAHLLGLTGCDIVKVESTDRPDGARRGDPQFFDLLHAGHRAVALDFRSESGRAALRALVASADVVIEASRPRALRALGIDAERAVDDGTIWVSITAYGRAPVDECRVGFGDDVAAGAGLVAFDRDGVPLPAGDAIADPLTGVHAATAAHRALAGDHGQLIDVSMHDVSRAAAGMPSARTEAIARPPVARQPHGPAPGLGQHTAEVLSDVC
jgi:hypothetical protein